MVSCVSYPQRLTAEVQIVEKWQKSSTLALKPMTDFTRSPKEGYQWSHKKDLCPPKIFLKSGKKVICYEFEIIHKVTG